MNPKRKNNLRRLLAPDSIAFIGGGDADYSAAQCARKFKGHIWGVNPKRQTMGGRPCFPALKDLPAAPDAVFLATPRAAAVPILTELNAMGAGGVVCFTAGYGETGEEGKKRERELVDAAGDLALVGPNCYGIINYIHDATLWPFGAGNDSRDRGAALIMQSGMIPADMAMNQRSVPLSYVISAGNQAVLAVEDYIDILVDDASATGFGVYIEGIKDIKKFADASLKALEAEKPIVALKAGSSSIGARLAVSHTGSLSGSDEAHQALFDRLGVIRVNSPELMLETLKFITVSGVPEGNRIAAFTCSGGEALMVADYCESKGLALPQPSDSCRRELESLLPDIATVSNPLDYTTPLWGDEEVMPRVFAAALKDGFDAAVFIQDYPPENFDADSSLYRADGLSYMKAAQTAGIPAGICSELAENFDRASRETFIEGGVTPLQGFDRGLDAIALACGYYAHRQRIGGLTGFQPFTLIDGAADTGGKKPNVINEWDSKQRLKKAGIGVPDHELVGLADIAAAQSAAQKIGYPVAVKLSADNLAHKTESGAVQLNLHSPEQLETAMKEIQSSAADSNPDLKIRGIIVEGMIKDVIHELLIGVRKDSQFGLVMVIASGGILVELYKDLRTILLPTSVESIKYELSRLQCYPLLNGYRGRPKSDIENLAVSILAIAGFAEDHGENILEMDINPLMVTKNGIFAADALLCFSD